MCVCVCVCEESESGRRRIFGRGCSPCRPMHPPSSSHSPSPSLPTARSHVPRSMGAWIYDRDPFQPMVWEDSLNSFKAKLAKGQDVFGSLIRKYILDNKHRWGTSGGGVVYSPTATTLESYSLQWIERGCPFFMP